MEEQPKIMIGEQIFTNYADALTYVENLDQSELDEDKSSIIDFLRLHMKIEQINAESSKNRRKELELKCVPLANEQIAKLSPEEFDDKILMRAELSKLSGSENSVLWQLEAIDILEMEVNNGGFHQYFLNTENKNSTEAIKGLILIDANTHLTLLEKAIKIYNEHWEDDELSMEKMGELDKEFYALESIQAIRINYLVRNKKKFEDFLN